MSDTLKRDELAKIFNCNCEHCYGRQNAIAEYCLAREKALIARVRKPLDEYKEFNKYKNGSASWGKRVADDVIDKSLSILDEVL